MPCNWSEVSASTLTYRVYYNEAYLVQKPGIVTESINGMHFDVKDSGKRPFRRLLSRQQQMHLSHHQSVLLGFNRHIFFIPFAQSEVCVQQSQRISQEYVKDTEIKTDRDRRVGGLVAEGASGTGERTQMRLLERAGASEHESERDKGKSPKARGESMQIFACTCI